MNSGWSRIYTTCWSRGSLIDVEIQVLIRSGLPRFDIIGLPENVIKEGRDRILSALHFLGIHLSKQKVLVNLHPSSDPKEGGHFDLPILVGVLKSLGQLPPRPELKEYFWGGLHLDGSVQKLSAAHSHILFADQSAQAELNLCASTEGSDSISPILPWLKSPLRSLDHVSKIFSDRETLKAPMTTPIAHQKAFRWNHLRGSYDQFLLFSLAAVGRLHLLIEGPPGVGKSTWCQAYKDILPRFTPEAWLSRLKIAPFGSGTELLDPPFEAPHHTASTQAIVGGGSNRVDPGAITRAHGGVLFLDELLEFHRPVIESLREPLEEKRITIFRKGISAELAANFQLLASMNPCPCGYYQSQKICECSTNRFQSYRNKLSGPLLDRFHVHSWWRFEDFDIPDEFEVHRLRERISRAQQRIPPHLEDIKPPQDLHPRKRIRWLEFFAAWCRWHEIDRPSLIHRKEFHEFYEKFKIANQLRPKLAS